MAVMFNVRLPLTHTHNTQTFHLLNRYTGVPQIDGSGDGVGRPVFAVGVADPEDFQRFADPQTHLGKQMAEYAAMDPVNRPSLVIDGATEGWAFETKMFEAIHRNLGALNIPPSSVLVITTNHVLPAVYKAWATQFDVRPLRFFVFDYWCYKLAAQLNLELAKSSGATDLDVPSFAVDRKVLSLNRLPKAHRAAVILKLIEADEIDRSLVSFMPDATDLSPATTASLLNYCASLGWPYLSDLLPRWPDLLARLPIVLDQDANSAYLSFVFGQLRSADYDRVGFTVITESDFGVNNVDRVTEKPFKAVANHCPFLLVGQPRQLARMTSLGFETYPMFDNSYDQIVDPNQRLRAVLGEMDRLCRLSFDELQTLRLAQHAACVRNFRSLTNYGTDERLATVANGLSEALDRLSS